MVTCVIPESTLNHPSRRRVFRPTQRPFLHDAVLERGDRIWAFTVEQLAFITKDWNNGKSAEEEVKELLESNP